MILFITLQALLSKRVNSYFITHIHSHTRLPGPLTEGNAKADSAVHAHSLFTNPFQSHAFFHQNAKSLSQSCHISLQQAQQIVRSCAQCTRHFPISDTWVNPQSLHSNSLWQMDVTHSPQLTPWKYLMFP